MIALERAAFQAVQSRDRILEGDPRLQFGDAGVLQIRLRLQDIPAGDESGGEAGVFQVVLPGAEFSGQGGNLHLLGVGGDRTHGGTNLHQYALFELADGERLLIEGGQALAIARFVADAAPRIGHRQINLPRVVVAIRHAVEGVRAAAAKAVEANDAIEVDGRLEGVLGDGEVEPHLVELHLGGDIIGLVVERELVGRLDQGQLAVEVFKSRGAQGRIEFEPADESEQGIGSILDRFLGGDHVAAGVRHADLGLQNVDISCGANRFLRLRLFEQLVGQVERNKVDAQLFPGVDQVVVVGLRLLHNLENLGPEVETG